MRLQRDASVLGGKVEQSWSFASVLLWTTRGHFGSVPDPKAAKQPVGFGSSQSVDLSWRSGGHAGA